MSSSYKNAFAAPLPVMMQLIVLPLTCVAVLFCSTWIFHVPFGPPYQALAIIASLLCILALQPAFEQERRTRFSSSWNLASNIGIAWIVVVGALLLLGYATKVSDVYSRLALFSWFLMAPVFMGGVALVLRNLSNRALMRPGMARSAIIVGGNHVSQRLAQSIVDRPEFGLVVAGVFDDRSQERLDIAPICRLLGRFSDATEFVRKKRIDTVFVTLPFNNLQRNEALLDELQDSTASIYFVPDLFVFDLIQSKLIDLNGIPVVALRETPFEGWRGIAKRTLDVVLASLMILIASPLLVLVALAVRLTTNDSVIFRQRRYGLDGQEIVVYKFRTMATSDDGAHVPQARKNDPRVTSLGRFLRRYSLDELPQLFNVLQGRMSLVGPRPHAVAHNESYRKLITGYMGRHKVPPGITGLAQVNGCRGETSTLEEMRRRVDFDLHYLRHWSPMLDLKILARTMVVLFRDDKAI